MSQAKRWLFLALVIVACAASFFAGHRIERAKWTPPPDIPTPREMGWRIVSPTNAKTTKIVVTIPCCIFPEDNFDRIWRVEVADIAEITEFGRGCMVKTKYFEAPVTNRFNDIYRQLYGGQS